MEAPQGGRPCAGSPHAVGRCASQLLLRHLRTEQYPVEDRPWHRYPWCRRLCSYAAEPQRERRLLPVDQWQDWRDRAEIPPELLVKLKSDPELDALVEACERVRKAVEGERNGTLNSEAFQIAKRGKLDPS